MKRLKMIVAMIFFFIDYNHRRIEKLQIQINNLQLLQNSNVIKNLFFCHKTKSNVKICMQNNLIANN